MNGQIQIHVADHFIFTVSVLVNILMAALFLFRKAGKLKYEHSIGLFLCSLALPVTVTIIYNLVSGRLWWTYVLPVPLVLFLIAEYLLDYHYKIEFRTTKLLGPYLLLYYLALFGLIGYSYIMGTVYGVIVLTVYFVNIIAAWYAHR